MFDYSKLSKEDLIDIIEKSLDQTEKASGLVWTPQIEDVVLRTKKSESFDGEYPVLKEAKEYAITCSGIIDKKDQKNWWNITNDFDYDNVYHTPHILIEGDNYHALSILHYTHKGTIDVIYIDPPYNTGNMDFMFNDKFVDPNDKWRHSKYISFMEPRLRLAKDLLSENGIIFISIDDNEFAQLKLLCDEIFGEQNFISTLIWNKKRTHGNKSKGVVDWHEYILVYGKSDIKDRFFEIPKNEKQKKSFKFTDENGPYRLLRLEMGTFVGQDRPKCKYGITAPDNSLVYPEKNWWRWGEEKYLSEKDRIVVKKSRDKWVPYFKDYLNENGKEKTTSPPSIIEGIYNSEGANELKNIFNGKSIFNNPKPTRLIKYLFSFVNNKNAKILDFFTGSGTTGHAVLEMNKEDGGNRQFILCTNNENNICIEVCYPRLKKVIEGYTKLNDEKVEGIPANLRYYKTDFVNRSENRDQMKYNLSEKVEDLICLKEGVYSLIETASDEHKVVYKVFEHGNKAVGLLYDTFEDELIEKLNFKLSKYDEKIVYSKDEFIEGLDDDINVELMYDDIVDILNDLFEKRS